MLLNFASDHWSVVLLTSMLFYDAQHPKILAISRFSWTKLANTCSKSYECSVSSFVKPPGFPMDWCNPCLFTSYRKWTPFSHLFFSVISLPLHFKWGHLLCTSKECVCPEKQGTTWQEMATILPSFKTQSYISFK